MSPNPELPVEFLTRPRADKDHPRHRHLRSLERKLERVGFDFEIFRELFERYVGEGLIATGGEDGSGNNKGLVEMREVALGPKGLVEINPIEKALGTNSHQEARYQNLANFFERYDASQPDLFFSKKMYLDTDYFRKEIFPKRKGVFTWSVRLLSSLASQDPFERIARERVAMLENFRNSGGRLVSNSKSGHPSDHLRYFDLPWAFDYFGYVKERDGAHRRATLHYLGQPSIPTLVLNFSKVTPDVCASVTKIKTLPADFSRFRAMVQSIVETNSSIS